MTELADAVRERMGLIDSLSIAEMIEALKYKYTNQVPISTDENGDIYNETGYLNGYRLNSSGTFTEQVGSVVTGFIPAINTDTIRIKGVLFTKYSEYQIYSYVAMFDENKNKISSENKDYASSYTITDEDDGTTTIVIKKQPTTAYVRISAVGSGKNMIVIVNEEITED